MMPRYCALISQEVLAQKILDATWVQMDAGDCDSFSEYGINPEMWPMSDPAYMEANGITGPGNVIEFIHNHSNMMPLKYLTSQVGKDLNKVDFDCENLSADQGIEAFADAGEITGFRTLPNGVTYLGVTAGGDWESPLFFIIYWDGTKLRGYLPKDGNPWNTKTKKAYGNDEAADIANQGQRYGRDPDLGVDVDCGVDCDKVIADITARILPR